MLLDETLLRDLPKLPKDPDFMLHCKFLYLMQRIAKSGNRMKEKICNRSEFVRTPFTHKYYENCKKNLAFLSSNALNKHKHRSTWDNYNNEHRSTWDITSLFVFLVDRNYIPERFQKNDFIYWAIGRIHEIQIQFSYFMKNCLYHANLRYLIHELNFALRILSSK